MQLQHLLLAIGICGLVSCSDPPPTGGVVPGEMEFDGLRRTYLYYAPTDLPPGAPLVLVLHGFTSSADTIMHYSGMNDVADAGGFAVVYPQGSRDREGNTFWQVGYDFHATEAVNDTGFLVHLVQELQREYGLSVANTFVTGMSNGGDMTYLLACRYAEVFRAAAPVAGTMMAHYFTDCTPAAPLPLLAIAGTADPITRYTGDLDNADGWGAYLAVPDIIDFWARRIAYDTLTIDTLPNTVPADSSFVVRSRYRNTATNQEIRFYRIEGGGHDWPGAWGNEELATSAEIWRFFIPYLAKAD